MTGEPTTAAGPRCTCTPPDGVTRNHANGCALFDVWSAYRQARAAALADVTAAVEGLHVLNLVGISGDASVDGYVLRPDLLAAIKELENR